MHLSENSAESLGFRRERCWSYIVSLFENTPKILVVQGRVQLEYSSHIVKVGVEATSFFLSLQLFTVENFLAYVQ